MHVNTTWANIYVGLRVGYTEELVSLNTVRKTCENFCNKVSLCVTLTQTEFIYKDGSEPGVIVGLINYPRFPTEPADLYDLADALAQELKIVARQTRVTVVNPHGTTMFGNKN